MTDPIRECEKFLDIDRYVSWTTKQGLLGLGELAALLAVLLLSLISPPLALVAAIALALPTLGVSATVGLLVMIGLGLALIGSR